MLLDATTKGVSCELNRFSEMCQCHNRYFKIQCCSRAIFTETSGWKLLRLDHSLHAVCIHLWDIVKVRGSSPVAFKGLRLEGRRVLKLTVISKVAYVGRR